MFLDQGLRSASTIYVYTQPNILRSQNLKIRPSVKKIPIPGIWGFDLF